MRPIEQLLTQYAAYHRDRRNIATHFFGIPIIVFAIVLALAVVSFPVAGVAITPAAVACIAAVAYYLRLDVAFGVAMVAVFFAMCAAESEVTARLADGPAPALAAALFVAGWALQFWGHRFEGMKPAFFDAAKQLLVGPLSCAPRCSSSSVPSRGFAATSRSAWAPPWPAAFPPLPPRPDEE